MSSDRLIWHRGRIVPVHEATINILSPACQYGINVFETVRCYWQEDGSQLFGFRLQDHIHRLLSSAKMLRLEVALSANELQVAFIDTVRANGFREDISVRQTIYLDAAGGWAAPGPTAMFIAPIPMGRSFPNKEGLHCRVSSWERINDRTVSPRIKAGANYLNSRMAQLETVVDGYDSAILMNSHGNIAEAPGSCLFIVSDGRLITPPLTASVLESITRSSILQIAADLLHLPTAVRDIARTELYTADEIFLCGTSVEVVPVLSVDRIPVGSGHPGDVTENLRARYLSIARGQESAPSNWLTPLY